MTVLPGLAVDAGSLALVDFNKSGGLVPALVQHAQTGNVLMLGYMNRAALDATVERRRVVFFSRSRGVLWEKGETSGHTLDLVSIRMDCDADTLLIEALPRGPVCHTGSETCFGASAGELPGFLGTLQTLIADRFAAFTVGGSDAEARSYTSRLFASGPKRIAQKVGEEGVETALAGAAGETAELISESADLLFHLLVLLRSRGVELQQVLAELQQRHAAPVRQAQ